jgi:hypothetical protein
MTQKSYTRFAIASFIIGMLGFPFTALFVTEEDGYEAYSGQDSAFYKIAEKCFETVIEPILEILDKYWLNIWPNSLMNTFFVIPIGVFYWWLFGFIVCSFFLIVWLALKKVLKLWKNQL